MERYTAEDMYLLALLECVVGSEIEVQKNRTFAIHAKMNNKQAKRLRSLLKHALKTNVDVADDGGKMVVKIGPRKK